MSVVTFVVVGVSMRSSSHSSLATAPAGVVATTPSPTPTPAATGQATRKRVVSPRKTATATPSPTGAATTRAPQETRVTTPTPTPTRTAAKSVTVNGQPADTQYGPVQVQITVTGGKITRSDAIVYPQESGRDQEINSYAIPQLDQETIDAQNAQIDTVSGATYTSDGYIQSLQSAIDAAHSAGAL